MEPSVWLIAGPTASGKSALALRLAEAAGAHIVNADSMQVYRGIERLTAAPGPQDRQRVPHHLYGVADPKEAWSAGRWLGAALKALSIVAQEGRPAVVVGGTGLYLRALTSGLAPTPAIPAEVRAAVAALEAEGGEDALRAGLAQADPAGAAAIARGDAMRLRRALEVLMHTGEPISVWRGRGSPPLAPARWSGVVLTVDRAVLAARARTRLARMAAEGALDEVRALMAMEPPAAAPALKALGVRELWAHLEGRCSLEEALDRAATATRQYAKRQATWFRGQDPRLTPVLASAGPPDLEAVFRALGVTAP